MCTRTVSIFEIFILNAPDWKAAAHLSRQRVNGEEPDSGLSISQTYRRGRLRAASRNRSVSDCTGLYNGRAPMER